MTEPEWLDIEIMLDVHTEQLALFGGPEGVRDSGLLESALVRPINETDLASLAAAYAFGIAKNHPFVDGNKRAAFASLIVFLGLNGIDFAPPPEAATAVMLSLAAGEVSEESLARWIRDNWPKSRASLQGLTKPRDPRRKAGNPSHATSHAGHDTE